MSSFTIITVEYFDKKYLKLIKKEPLLKRRVAEVFKILRKDPFYTGLKTHKVISLNHGKKWASYVNNNLRIIWDFDNENLRILNIYDIGGHSGSKKVYK